MQGDPPALAALADRVESGPSLAKDYTIEDALRDPALIQTHEDALEVLEVLDYEIARITAKIKNHDTQHEGRDIPGHLKDWSTRARTALYIRRGARRRVIQRDREIRGVIDPEVLEGKIASAKRAEAQVAFEAAQMAAKTERIAARAEALKADAAARQSFHRAFVKAAAAMLPQETMAAICERARASLDPQA